MASEEAEDFSKLSTEELILHKSWKARAKGYEDAVKLFGKATSEKDPVFNKFLGLVKQFVSDSNQVALEKGLDAAYAFVENAAVAPKTAGETCPLLVQKCLGLPKQKLRDKAQEILLMYVEVEKPDVVAESLLEGLHNKNPKLVSAALATFTTAINQFGPKAISVKQLLKQIGPLMEHRDADVRGKTKSLAIEVYKWIGSALKPQLQTLTPLQISELEAEFANVAGDKPTPARYLRSQMPKGDVQTEVDTQASGDTADSACASAAPSEQQEMDPWEFLTPFDLVSKLPQNFYEQVESKKWSERKEKLEELEKLIKDNPRLDPNATYGELISVLKKVIGKDSNINVVAVAGKCMAGLALGLRKKFGTYAGMIAPVILEKFKEKKPVVATSMVECIDAVSRTTTLDALTEDLIAALDSKTPSVKVQTSLFLSRYFSECSPAVLNKKVLKAFCPALLKLLSESDVEVREAGCTVLGTAMKVVGEKIILPFLEDVVNDHLKMDKIRACCEKAEVKITIVSAGGDAPKGATVKKPAEPSTKPKSAPGKPAVRPKQEPAQEDDDGASAAEAPKKPVASAASKTRPSTAKGARPAANAKKPAESAKAKKDDDSSEGGALIDVNQKPQRFQEEKALKVLKWQFTTPTEEHTVQLKGQLSIVCKPFLHTQMFHPDFKQHLKALDSLTAAVELCPDAVINSLDLLLKWCTLRFFDTNPSVLSKCLTFIRTALTMCHDRGVELHDIEINSFVPFLLLKAGESKDTVRTEVRKITDALCKLYPASKLFPLIMDGCKSKNARQRAECLEQVAMMIEVYGISVCGTPASASLKLIAQCIGDRDNTVRNAALNGLVAAYFQVGERLFNMVGNLSSKEFAMLEERIKRMTKNKPVITKPTPEKQERPKVAGGTVTITKPTVRPQRNSSPPDSRSPVKYEDYDEGSPERQPRQRSTPPTVTRPRGKFHLEMNKMGLPLPEQERLDHEAPELFDHAEAMAVLASPMQMPTLRFRSPNQSMTTQRREVITQSMDASTALDTAINSVTSNKIDVATHAIAQLDEIIKDSSKVNLLSDKVDQLLMAIYFQFRMAFNTHMVDESISSEDVLCLYRHLCVILLSMLSAGQMVRDASEGTLKDLLCQLLTVLLDDRLEKMAEGEHIIRSLNVLIVKLVVASDTTSCLVALLRLLRDTLHSQTSSKKFLQLVLKCLWKLSREMNHTTEVQIGRVLAEANAFFMDFPTAAWKQRGDEQPLRTVKTLLYKLAELYGDKVLDCVDVIEQPETSEVVACLKKSLRELSKAASATANTNGAVAATETPSAGRNVDGNSTNYNSELNDILKKIGSKEKSKEGLCELYDFKQRQPNFDIEPFLNKSSDFFRNYITRGLEQVAADRRAHGPDIGASSGDGGAAINNVPGTVSNAYLEKLQKFRAACGLDPVALATSVRNEDDSGSTLPQVRMTLPETMEPGMEGNGDAAAAQPRLTTDEVNEYKARMERVKRGY